MREPRALESPPRVCVCRVAASWKKGEDIVDTATPVCLTDRSTLLASHIHLLFLLSVGRGGLKQHVCTPSPSGLAPVYKSSLRRVSTDTDTDVCHFAQISLLCRDAPPREDDVAPRCVSPAACVCKSGSDFVPRGVSRSKERPRSTHPFELSLTLGGRNAGPFL